MTPDIPGGGTTGLCHEHSAAIDQAVQWLLTAPQTQRSVIPELRQRFGLTTAEACAACREAHLQKARAA